MAYSDRPQDVQRGVQDLIRRRAEHERKSGTALPDTRKIEKWAGETAQRVDRRHQDNRK